MPGTITEQQRQTEQPQTRQQQTENAARQKDQTASWRLWQVVAVGSVLLLFSYGANNIALAAWLSPVFLLRFVRNQRWRVWIPVVYVIQAAASMFQLRGMIPIQGAAYYITLAVEGIPGLVPFIVDRWLARRIGGFSSTLVFPCICTVLDYLNSFGPYGSWGTEAYSQYGNLPLLQILSVTGMWGVTFLIAWFAAVCNYVWEEGWNCKRARTAAYVCGSTIAAVILLGGLRMTVFPPSSETVRIASLSARNVGVKPVSDVWDRLIQNQATAADLAAIRDWSAAVDDNLLARAESEAQSGAKIIFWAEGNAMIFKEDEAAFLARGSQLAAKYHIYLGMALATWNLGQTKPLENKLALVEPDGQIAWQYYKAHPVPGDEASVSITKDGKLRYLDTPFGRLSTAICFDGDFPQLLAQAGAMGADIVLSPSNDWRAIDPWHTQMVSFRAIEQGVNLDRQTSHGLSAAFDYQGRALAEMDHFHTADYAMVADVPTKGVRTIYSRLGDWFAWVCMALLVVLAILPFVISSASRKKSIRN
jgi:apolipoprotein N-acyltransferase